MRIEGQKNIKRIAKIAGDGKFSMSTEQDSIIYKTDNKIATITIDRPTKMNAFRLEEFERIINCISMAQYDVDIQVIKIRSTGDRAFTGGLDLSMVAELATNQDKIKDLLETGERAFKTIIQCPKPIVIEVQGPAVGWGTILCLLADFVLAGDNPKTFFALNEIDVGIFPGTGALSVALYKTGLKEAKRMLLIPEKLFLEEAVKNNIVTKRVPLENLAEETELFCQNLASKPSNILFPIKMILNNLHLHNVDKSFDMERKGFEMFMKNDIEFMLKTNEKLWKSID